MAHKRKVPAGGYFYLADGTAMKNESDRTVKLALFSREEMEQKASTTSENNSTQLGEAHGTESKSE